MVDFTFPRPRSPLGMTMLWLRPRREQELSIYVIFIMTALAQTISTLPVEERLQLVWDIWDSIAEDQSNIPVSEEDKAEIRRRLELYRKGELTSDTWENVRAKILATRR